MRRESVTRKTALDAACLARENIDVPRIVQGYSTPEAAALTANALMASRLSFFCLSASRAGVVLSVSLVK
jgi:hypothetical protein